MMDTESYKNLWMRLSELLKLYWSNTKLTVTEKAARLLATIAVHYCIRFRYTRFFLPVDCARPLDRFRYWRGVGLSYNGWILPVAYNRVCAI